MGWPPLPAGPSNHAWQGLLVRLFPPMPRGRGSTLGGLLRLAQRVGLDQLLYVRLAALFECQSTAPQLPVQHHLEVAASHGSVQWPSTAGPSCLVASRPAVRLAAPECCPAPAGTREQLPDDSVCRTRGRPTGVAGVTGQSGVGAARGAAARLACLAHSAACKPVGGAAGGETGDWGVSCLDMASATAHKVLSNSPITSAPVQRT